MKKMTLVFSNGNKATYDKSEIRDLKGVYDDIRNSLVNNAKCIIVETDEGKHKTLVNMVNLVAVDVEY